MSVMIEGWILGILTRWSGELSASGMIVGLALGTILGAITGVTWHLVDPISPDLFTAGLLFAILGLFPGAVIGAYVGKAFRRGH